MYDTREPFDVKVFFIVMLIIKKLFRNEASL